MSILDKIINKAQATLPRERQVQGMHLFQKAKRVVLGDTQPVFVEEPTAVAATQTATRQCARRHARPPRIASAPRAFCPSM